MWGMGLRRSWQRTSQEFFKDLEGAHLYVEDLRGAFGW